MSILCSMVGANFATVAAVVTVLRSKKGITAVGAAVTVSTTQNKFGGSSAYFNGSSYFNSSSSSDFAFGTGDFTIECWVYPTASPSTWRPILSVGSASGGNLIRLNQDFNGSGTWGALVPANGGGDAYTLYSASALSLNTWTHIACVRNGSTVTIYANGTQAAQLTSQTWSFTDTTGVTAGFGMYGGDGYYFGYIDEIRISNTARYTAGFTPSTTPFVNDANTLFLMHANGTDASTFFEDDNGSTTIRTAKTITAVGNAQLSTAQSKFGQSSMLFDGSGDSVTVAHNNDLRFGTGDFTMEFWYRPISKIQQYPVLLNNRNGFSAGSIVFSDRHDANNTKLSIYIYNLSTSTPQFISTTTTANNTWYHIALSRSGTSLRLFVNGTQEGSTVTTSADIDTGAGTDSYYIGRDTGPSDYNGYIDEVRISKVARYTANFTAPTATFENDANTVLLVHAEGANASTTVTDDTSGRSPRGIIALGGAAISTTQSKFGGSSMSFGSASGGNGKYAFVNQSYTDFYFGAGGDKTYECWVYLTAYTPSGTNNTGEGAFPILTLSRGADGYVKWCFGINESGYLGVDYSATSGFGGTTYYNNSTTLALNTWHHIAMTWQDSTNTVNLYANGTRLVNQVSAAEPNWEGGIFGLYIGGFYWTPTGFIDEVRISNTLRYTAAFTAPTQPFVNDANTLLLMHTDGTNGSTVFRDDNGALANRQPAYITAVGNAQIDAGQYKFGEVSAQFDGTDDLLRVYDNNTFSVGTGDYTVEAWIRPTSVGSQSRCIFDFDIGANSNFPIFYISSSSKLSVYNVPMGGTEGATTVTTNTWHHVVLSRSSGETKAALNGVWQFSKSNSYSIGNASFRSIGAATNAADDFVGHIDEIRVSNIARYNHGGNFTPATAAFTNDANTLLLIHADAVDATSQFYDDTGNRMQKGISAVGNAQIDTAQSKFGGASLLGDGNGDYLQIGTYGDLNLGANFTIECWYRIPGAVPAILPFYNTDHLVYLTYGAVSGGRYALFAAGDNRTITSDITVSANTWYHMAMVRVGTTVTFYHNGVSVGSGSWGPNIGNTTPTIGAYLGYFLNGHIDEYRISRTARYTANFTPSTTPFQNDADTLLLLHMDGTDGSTVFIDDNGIAPYTP